VSHCNFLIALLYNLPPRLLYIKLVRHKKSTTNVVLSLLNLKLKMFFEL